MWNDMDNTEEKWVVVVTTHFSSVFSISFHNFLLYFPYLFTIQLTFLLHFPILFTISSVFCISFHNFLPYFPYFFTIQLTFLPYFLYLFTIFVCIFQFFSLFSSVFSMGTAQLVFVEDPEDLTIARDWPEVTGSHVTFPLTFFFAYFFPVLVYRISPVLFSHLFPVPFSRVLSNYFNLFFHVLFHFYSHIFFIFFPVLFILLLFSRTIFHVLFCPPYFFSRTFFRTFFPRTLSNYFIFPYFSIFPPFFFVLFFPYFFKSRNVRNPTFWNIS